MCMNITHDDVLKSRCFYLTFVVPVYYIVKVPQVIGRELSSLYLKVCFKSQQDLYFRYENQNKLNICLNV